jgi:hypothetical protein
MLIIFHSGPHKTATTAIQEALSVNREALMKWGVFVPNSSVRIAGFHELPWAHLGWDTRLLFKGARTETAEDILNQQLSNAVEAKCHTVLFSSEDLSLLNEAEWKNIFTQCRRFASRNNTREAQILVTFSTRHIQELVVSAYSTLVTLGIDSKFFFVRRSIKKSFETRYKRMSTLTSLDEGVRLKVVEYSSIGYLSRWIGEVIPEVPVSALDLTGSRPNQRPNPELVSTIRNVNRRFKLKFSKNLVFAWPTFQTVDVLLDRQEIVHKLMSESAK